MDDIKEYFFLNEMEVVFEQPSDEDLVVKFLEYFIKIKNITDVHERLVKYAYYALYFRLIINYFENIIKNLSIFFQYFFTHCDGFSFIMLFIPYDRYLNINSKSQTLDKDRNYIFPLSDIYYDKSGVQTHILDIIIEKHKDTIIHKYVFEKIPAKTELVKNNPSTTVKIPNIDLPEYDNFLLFLDNGIKLPYTVNKTEIEKILNDNFKDMKFISFEMLNIFTNAVISKVKARDFPSYFDDRDIEMKCITFFPYNFIFTRFLILKGVPFNYHTVNKYIISYSLIITAIENAADKTKKYMHIYANILEEIENIITFLAKSVITLEEHQAKFLDNTFSTKLQDNTVYGSQLLSKRCEHIDYKQNITTLIETVENDIVDIHDEFFSDTTGISNYADKMKYVCEEFKSNIGQPKMDDFIKDIIVRKAKRYFDVDITDKTKIDLTKDDLGFGGDFCKVDNKKILLESDDRFNVIHVGGQQVCVTYDHFKDILDTGYFRTNAKSQFIVPKNEITEIKIKYDILKKTGKLDDTGKFHNLQDLANLLNQPDTITNDKSNAIKRTVELILQRHGDDPVYVNPDKFSSEQLIQFIVDVNKYDFYTKMLGYYGGDIQFIRYVFYRYIYSLTKKEPEDKLSKFYENINNKIKAIYFGGSFNGGNNVYVISYNDGQLYKVDAENMNNNMVFTKFVEGLQRKKIEDLPSGRGFSEGKSEGRSEGSEIKKKKEDKLQDFINEISMIKNKFNDDINAFPMLIVHLIKTVTGEVFMLRLQSNDKGFYMEIISNNILQHSEQIKNVEKIYEFARLQNLIFYDGNHEQIFKNYIYDYNQIKQELFKEILEITQKYNMTEKMKPVFENYINKNILF